MKIGFFAYSEYSLNPYFEMLRRRAHCAWVVFNWHLYRDLKSKKMGDASLVFFNNPLCLKLHPLINRIVNKCYKLLKMQPEQRTYELLISKANADVWLTDTTLLINRMNKVSAPKILIFHSVTYKEYILIKETTEYDLVLLPSEYFKQRMIQKFPHVDPKKLKVVGWPRNDVYSNSAYSREKTLRRLGLNPSKKTVIFAPTYDVFPRGRFFPEAWGCLKENFSRLCHEMKKRNLNFIVKFHGASHEIIGNKELRAIAEKHGVLWYNKINNAYLQDPRELLSASDILISDVSGVIIDFLPLDRPIIYVDVPCKSFWEKADLTQEDRAGFCVRNMEELIRAIKEGLEKPYIYQKERELLRSKVFYKPDGRASERACSTIMEFMHQREGSHNFN